MGDAIGQAIVAALCMAMLVAFVAGISVVLLAQFLWQHVHLSVGWIG